MVFVNRGDIGAWLCLMALLGFPACGRQAPKWRGRITHEAGLTVVKNPSTPKYQADILTLEEDLTIGRSGGKSEYIFSGIGDLAVDDGGNIYAIDDRDAQVRVFDKNGLFLRAIGRMGQGPGEFERPVFVQFTSVGELLVGDYAGRVAYFSRQGEFLRQQTMLRPIALLGRDSQGHFLGQEIAAPPPLGGKTIRKYDPDFKPLQVIAVELRGEDGVFDIGRPYCYATMTADDHIVWGDSKEYVLYKLDPTGKLVRRIEKINAFREIMSTDKKKYEMRYSEALKRGRRIRFREHFPAFCDIVADDRGRIFVKTCERAENDDGPFCFDIFDADGIYLANVPVKAHLDRNSVWKNGKLYTIEEGADGSPLIMRYASIWKD